MKTKFVLATLTGLTLFSSAAMAQSDDDDHGVYLGANYGYLKVDGDNDFDDDKDAYQLNLGYGFNQYFALEGSYVDFGDYGDDLANADTDGYSAGIRLSLPVSDMFSVHVKGGQLWYETEYSIAGISDDYDDQALFAGIGAKFHLSRSMAVTFDYTLYDADLDVDEATDDIDDANFSTDLKFAAVGFEVKF